MLFLILLYALRVYTLLCLKKGIVVNKYYIACCLLVSSHMSKGMDDSRKLTWDAKNYKENSKPQDDMALYALQQICLQEYFKVLDVGCGNGKTTAYIADQVPHGFVTGIDSSKSMIDISQNDYVMYSNLAFKLQDITTFESESQFDLVTAFNSLPWVKDQQKAYKNIAQSLVSGGKLLALVSDENSPILQAYRTAFALPQWQQCFENYNPSYYPCSQAMVEKHIMNAALRSVLVKKASLPWQAMHRDVFLKVLAGTPGVRDAIQPERYMNFLNDVLDEYLKTVPADQDGNIVLDAGLILVIAEKP